MSKRAIEFVSLCVETYKTEKKKSGRKVIELFDSFGITEFLIEVLAAV